VSEPDLHLDRRRADSFGEGAEEYDRSRPSYPAGLVDALLAGRPLRVLDVGCGTGLAARLFAGRGCDVLGIEPDPRMAEVARRHGVAVESATFESWDARGRRFDLLTAGQSWHWVDPWAGAAKATEVLRPGGRIGLFWNDSFLDPDVRAEIDALYAQHAPELVGHSVLVGLPIGPRYEATADVLRASGFEGVRLEQFPHALTCSTARFVELTSTHSDHRTLPGASLEKLLAGLGAVIERRGGEVEVRYETTLVTASTPAPCGTP